MRKVTCDLCGKELPNDTTATDVLGISVDVCEACQRWFNGLGTKKQLDLMFEGLRRARKQAIAAENGPVLRSPPPEPTEDQDGRTDGGPPGLKGRYAPLKRAVLEALEGYRKTYGPGVKGLAARAGVKEAEVELVRMRRKVPLAVWTGLAEALGVNDGKDE